MNHLKNTGIVLIALSLLVLSSCNLDTLVKSEKSEEVNTNTGTSNVVVEKQDVSGVVPEWLVMGEDPNIERGNDSDSYAAEGSYLVVDKAMEMDASSEVVFMSASSTSETVLYSVDASSPPADYSVEIESGSDAIMIDPGYENYQGKASVLTAGEWNDHEHWSEYRDFLREFPEYFTSWQIDVQHRILLQFIDQEGNALSDVQGTVRVGCEADQDITTQNDGKVVLFIQNKGQKCRVSQVNGKIIFEENAYPFEFEPDEDDDQLWKVTIPVKQNHHQLSLDLAFVVDVTGSMGDELRYLKQDLLSITREVQSSTNLSDLRISTIFYRDRGDDFVTKTMNFTSDTTEVLESFQSMNADGGGDFPESLNEALKEATQTIGWKESNAIRLMFVIADAPPHYYQDEEYTYRNAVNEAAQRAIKIIPVAASGIDKSTEYLFRILAVKTMGRYIFITDDSGVGSSHIEASVGEHDVETLHEILVRTILEEYQNSND